MNKLNYKIKTIFSILLLLIIFSCSNSTGTDQMKNPPKHVIMIGFDGMSANSIKNGVEMPTYRSMMKKGAYTIKNRSILPSSSAANWASLFMGSSPEQHGFNTWGSQKPDFPSRELTENNLYPDIFYLIRQVKPEAELGLIYEWGGIYYLADTKSIDKVKQIAPSIDNVDSVLTSITDYLTDDKPDFCAVVLDHPDSAGHSFGWESDEYYEMLNLLDNALKTITDAVKEAGMMNETIFVLVSDHGGTGTGHGGPTLDEMETPLVFYGKGIKSDFEIPESTMVYDIGSTIGYMFGVNQPQVWIGRPIMSIFEDN